jgi:hypothetical protein
MRLVAPPAARLRSPEHLSPCKVLYPWGPPSGGCFKWFVLKKTKAFRATLGKPRCDHDVRGLFAAALRYRAGADCAPVLLLALYAAVLFPARHETPRPACALLAPCLRPLSPCSPARPFACQLTAEDDKADWRRRLAKLPRRPRIPRCHGPGPRRRQE